jgi:hypothetical protein
MFVRPLVLVTSGIAKAPLHAWQFLLGVGRRAFNDRPADISDILLSAFISSQRQREKCATIGLLVLDEDV